METNLSKGLMTEAYRRMIRIRLFENEFIARPDRVGVGHSSVGMEASVVGACLALRDDDYMVGTHRSHGHPIGKGARTDRLAAELLGKATGINQGKGGSMHLSDFSVGSLGETSIVGSGLPVATGAGLGIKLQGLNRVALCFFGDGAANEGTFHESLNLASLWTLPVVYLCENNGYGELTAFKDACAADTIASRAAGYNMPGTTVDGQDVVAVYAAVAEAVERARTGGGPSLVETMTYRYNAHAGGPEPNPVYRSLEEVAKWKERDPIELFRKRLIDEQVLTDAQVKEIEADEENRNREAWAFAAGSPYPEPEAAYDHMYTNPITIRH
jgi:acetoin:2,6-dichlorophenolindophenol oxidoreductase subunit alpha